MKLKKIIDFYFPTTESQEKDFSPVDISVLKDYYRNSFLQLIDKVRINFILIFDLINRWEKAQKDYLLTIIVLEF